MSFSALQGPLMGIRHPRCGRHIARIVAMGGCGLGQRMAARRDPPVFAPRRRRVPPFRARPDEPDGEIRQRVGEGERPQDEDKYGGVSSADQPPDRGRRSLPGPPVVLCIMIHRNPQNMSREFSKQPGSLFSATGHFCLLHLFGPLAFSSISIPPGSPVALCSAFLGSSVAES